MRINGVTYHHPLANIMDSSGTGAGGGGADPPTGKSYSFDGVDDRVDADDAALAGTLNWDGAKSWSISTWFKNGGATTTPLYIWSACSTNPGVSRRMGVSTHAIAGVSYVRFIALHSVVLIEDPKSPSGGAGYVEVRSTDPNGITPGDGNWHNITITANTVASTPAGVKVYLDGLPAGFAQTAAVAASWSKLSFGCQVQRNGADRSAFFPGLLHQASMYDSELTAGEVAAVYNAGSPPDEMTLTPRPLNYYRFGNGDTRFRVLKDYGTSPQDGLAYNMALSPPPPGAIVSDAP